MGPRILSYKRIWHIISRSKFIETSNRIFKKDFFRFTMSSQGWLSTSSTEYRLEASFTSRWEIKSLASVDTFSHSDVGKVKLASRILCHSMDWHARQEPPFCQSQLSLQFPSNGGFPLNMMNLAMKAIENNLKNLKKCHSYVCITKEPSIVT